MDVEFLDFEISNNISVNLDSSPSNNNSLVSSLQIKSGTPQAGGNNIPSTTIQAPATRSPDNSSGASGYGGANIRGEGEGESKTEKRPILNDRKNCVWYVEILHRDTTMSRSPAKDAKVNNLL